MSEEIYEQELNCSHDCSSCSSNCSSRKPDKSQFAEPMNQYSNVKKVIGVVSGKGGVGKSFVTSYLAVMMQRMGYKTAILDADVMLDSVLESEGALAGYQSHPDHVAVANTYVRPFTEVRLCMDYEA